MLDHDTYRPAQRKVGRRMFINFELINTLSFSLLAGNIIMLLLMKFGASKVLLGIVQAMPYAAYLFMPLAKALVPHFGLVRTFGTAWTIRYLVIAPIVLAPLVVLWGYPAWGIGLVLLGYSLFQMTRGFGLVSISPLVQAISAGKDRGSWLSLKNMVVYGASMVAGLLISFSLSGDAPLERYSILMGAGMILGLVACSFIFRIPEPEGGKDSAKSPFFADLREALSETTYRRFFLAFGLYYFVSGMGRSFYVVYARKAAGFNDDTAMLLMVLSGLGPIAMGWFSRMALDRLGAKPLFILFHGGFLLATATLAFISPPGGLEAWIILGLVFTLGSLGGAGGENAAQAYFMGICKTRHQFNVGMFYYLVLGLSGALGSFAGGAALQLLGDLPGLARGQDWQWFFALVLVLGLVVLVFQSRLIRNKDVSVAQAFSSMVSPRAIRAMRLLQRLDNSTSLAQEELTLSKMAGSTSELVVHELLKRLGSPIFAIRNRALLALGKLGGNPRVEAALIEHVAQHQFATAYRAARMLGEFGSSAAIPTLRQALESPDYLLQAYSASALGELQDQESRPAMEAIVASSTNTLVMVHSLGALKQLRNPGSLTVLLGIMGKKDLGESIHDELIMAMGAICGIEHWFYDKYLVFLEQASSAAGLLSDELDAAGLGADRDSRIALVHQWLGQLEDAKPFYQGSRAILGDVVELGLLPPALAKDFLKALSAEDSEIQGRYRYLLSCLVVHVHIFGKPLCQVLEPASGLPEQDGGYTAPV